MLVNCGLLVAQSMCAVILTKEYLLKLVYILTSIFDHVQADWADI